MPTEFPDDGAIDELLRLAGLSTERSAARRWLESALVAARGTPEPRLVPQPAPAQHNAPLDEIERASDRLIAALKQLRSHPHAYASSESLDSKFDEHHDARLMAEFAEFLVEYCIDSISVVPDSFISVKKHVAEAESRRS